MEAECKSLSADVALNQQQKAYEESEKERALETVENLRTEIATLTEQEQDSRHQVSRLENDVKKLEKEKKRLNGELASLNTKFNDLTAKHNALSKSFEATSRSLDDANDKLKAVGEERDELAATCAQQQSMVRS